VALRDYMDRNPDVGIAAPRIVNPDGTLQGLNKRYPDRHRPCSSVASSRAPYGALFSSGWTITRCVTSDTSVSAMCRF